MAATAYSAPPRDARIAEINITPLVDVMLVLLVIFMIAAPAVTNTLSMRLPASGRPDAVPPPQLMLEVDVNGGYALDGRALTRDALLATLRDTARRTPQAIVRIQAAQDADYQAFASALAAARASGLENVTLAN